MTSCEPAPLLMSNSADLVEAVPFLLGFHPTESLVVLGFRRSEQGPPLAMALTARTDLDPADETGLDRASAAAMRHALLDADCEAAIAVVFPGPFDGDPRQHEPTLRTVGAVTALLDQVDITLLEALLVEGDRWWSLSCDDPACCPPEGNERQPTSSMAAELTYAGLVVRPDRDSLLATLDGRDPAARERLLPALHRADQRLSDLLERNGPERARRTESSALVRAAYECEHGVRLSPRRLARLGAALRDIPIRDALWLALDAKDVAAGALLEQLHRALPTPYDAAPMFLYGWAKWRAGNGTLASAAADRALESDPKYSAADLLLEAVQTGLDPFRTPGLLGQSV